MTGPAINKMMGNTNILIRNSDAEDVFRKLGIDTKVNYLMDVKKAIFKFYKFPKPEMTVRNPRKTLYEQRPNNAYGIKITDKEIRIFMELFELTENDPFQDISRRI